MYSTPADIPASGADPSDRAARRLGLLEELAEIGMALARDVRRQAEAAAEAGQEPPADLGLKFARIARAVRQTLALEARLEEGKVLADREAVRWAERQAALAAERQYAARKTEGRARRRQASEAVERLFDPTDEEGFERLELEVCDWLDGYRDDALADRPVAEIVLDICRGLNLTPDWSLWADEPWAREAEAAPTAGQAATQSDTPPAPATPQAPQCPPGRPPPPARPARAAGPAWMS